MTRRISQRELCLTPPIFPDSFFDIGSCAATDPREDKLLPTSADVTVKSIDTMCEDTFALAVLVTPDDTKDECTDPP